MTIRKKLIIIFIFLIILPSICLQIWSNHVVSDIMLNHICQAENHALNSAIQQTENVFTEMNRILVWLSADLEVRQLLENETERTNTEDGRFSYEQLSASEKILDRSQLLLMKYPFEILLVPVQGRAYGNCENIQQYAENIRGDVWFEKVLQTYGSKIHWMDTSSDIIKDAPHSFFAAMPVRSITHPREAIGIAYIAISETYICETLERVNPYGDAYLVNGDDKIVSAKDKLLIHFPAASLIETGSLNFEKGSWREVTQNVQQAFALRSDAITEKWNILAFVPKNIVLGQLYQTFRRLLAFNIAIVSVCVLIALGLASMLSKPIVRLSNITRQVEQGDLSAHVPETSHGEVGMLERNFNRMVSRIKTMMDDLRKQERRRTEAEIDALQAQINPHFLFNVLSSIRWASKDEAVEKMVVSLCTLLKASMRRGGNVIALKEECNLLQQYIELNNLRHQGKVVFFNELPEQMRDLQIPRFLLQPLIENSIIHGFEFVGGSGEIRLQGEICPEGYIIRVVDNGCGFPPNFEMECPPARSHRHASSLSSIALKNVAERLSLFYGDKASLSCENRMDLTERTIGACVTLRIPTLSEEKQICITEE